MTKGAIPEVLKEAISRPDEAYMATGLEDFRKALKDSKKTRDYVVIKSNSLHEFIQYVTTMQDVLSRRKTFIFRGHRECGWKLTPSLMRDDLFPQGQPDSTKINALEDQLLTKFKNRAMPLISHTPSGPEERLQWTALAQHHNLPTRLLDWTYRAGTALYFAVENSRVPESGFSCVWAIQAPVEYDASKNDYATNPEMDVRLYNPPHVSPRITAQRGCFTIHPSHYPVRKFKWIESKRVIFLVPVKHRQQLRRELRTIGAGPASVYPDLDGVARSLIEDIRENLFFHKQPYA